MRKSSVDIRGGAVIRGVLIVGRVGAGLVCGLRVWGLGFEAQGVHLRLVVVLQLLHNLPNNYHNAKV